METINKFLRLFISTFFLAFSIQALMLIFTNCESKKTNDSYIQFIDHDIPVYGPYTVIKLPIKNGVEISNPLQISLGPGGLIFASNQTGEIYTLRDNDGDGIEDTALIYCNVKDFGLRSPSGFAYRGDTVYIGTAQQIRAFIDLDKDGKADSSWVFFDDIPESGHPYEWSTGLEFGPDGSLFVALATDSWNAAPSPDPKGYRGSILKISPDGKVAEAVATGIRSVYGIRFNTNGDLFFTDNEGGGNPSEELNILIRDGFYGHNPKKYQSKGTIEPIYSLNTEVAPSGMVFNPKENDFGGSAGNLFIAYYGPGERWTRGAIGRLEIEPSGPGEYIFREYPIAEIPKLSGLAFGKDGSLYASQHGKADYWYNAVYENEGAFYRLIYNPEQNYRPAETRMKKVMDYSESSLEMGKQLYAEYACFACHSVDGTTELLGPNLKDIGKKLSREEILYEIEYPSEIIKPSMKGVKISKKIGQVMIGRIVNSNEKVISMMLVGNNVVIIDREEILTIEDEEKSLMYEGLTKTLSEIQVNALLDYLMSLND
jgi:putative heme-binding domain-containing protein